MSPKSGNINLCFCTKANEAQSSGNTLSSQRPSVDTRMTGSRKPHPHFDFDLMGTLNDDQKCNYMVMQQEKTQHIIKIIRIHPPETVSVCKTFHVVDIFKPGPK